MKKIIFISLTFVMMLILSPVVLADSYGKVTDITKTTGDSLTSGTGSIETKGNTTTIRYSAATFKMLEEDKNATDGERPGPAAWVGFEITEPTDKSDSSFKVTTPDNKTTQIKKNSYKDYVGITPDNLKKVLLNGTMLTYKYSFDWDEDGSNDQYVIIEIDPKGITLLPTKGTDPVWSPAIAQEILDSLNPETSDINLFLLIGLILAGGIGLICLKKA